VAIFDKTGTLTYGRPVLTQIIAGPGLSENEALSLIGSLERYSKHPLASAVTSLARERNVPWQSVREIHEFPGKGLTGIIDGHNVRVTSRSKLPDQLNADVLPGLLAQLPEQAPGMECVAVIDDRTAVTCRFRDQPRTEGSSFVRHLSPKHHFQKVMIVSGDRESEVRYLAEQVGIQDVHFGQTPEQKLELVRAETRLARTVFVGDGINDAPALTSATVGIAMGGTTDITSAAAHAVVLDSSLSKVDELLHIGRRLRQIVLQSALGGMLLSIGGMVLAAFGLLPPVTGAITQEVIDLVVVLNALRAARGPKQLTDFEDAKS
jgi:cation transport ATPase